MPSGDSTGWPGWVGHGSPINWILNHVCSFFLNKTFRCFKYVCIKSQHVGFLQGFIFWPKCLETETTKTEKSRDLNGSDRNGQTVVLFRIYIPFPQTWRVCKGVQSAFFEGTRLFGLADSVPFESMVFYTLKLQRGARGKCLTYLPLNKPLYITVKMILCEKMKQIEHVLLHPICVLSHLVCACKNCNIKLPLYYWTH